MTERSNRENDCAEKRLEELYRELADLIPEALTEDFVGMGFAKGKYYNDGETRILVVEKIPRPDRAGGQSAAEPKADEKDFSEITARIARSLLGVKEAEWPERVAWTYLYKLAPRKGKPDDVIYRKQKALCEEIIKLELQVLNPTHVLFFTGWSSVWDFDLPLTPLLKGEAVEAWGQTENGAKLIVTRYAVRKPEDKFALDIVEKIKRLEELIDGEAGI